MDKWRYIVFQSLCDNLKKDFMRVLPYPIKFNKNARCWVVETILLIRGTWSPMVHIDSTYVTRLYRHRIVADLLVSTGIWQKRWIDVFYQSKKDTVGLCLIYNTKWKNCLNDNRLVMLQRNWKKYFWIYASKKCSLFTQWHLYIPN